MTGLLSFICRSIYKSLHLPTFIPLRLTRAPLNSLSIYSNSLSRRFWWISSTVPHEEIVGSSNQIKEFRILQRVRRRSQRYIWWVPSYSFFLTLQHIIYHALFDGFPPFLPLFSFLLFSLLYFPLIGLYFILLPEKAGDKYYEVRTYLQITVCPL